MPAPAVMTRESALPIASAARRHVSAISIPIPLAHAPSGSSPRHDFPDRDYAQRGRGSTREQRSVMGYCDVIPLRIFGIPGTIAMGPPEISSRKTRKNGLLDPEAPHPPIVLVLI